MSKGLGDLRGFKRLLDRKEAELVQGLRRRGDIAIEQSPDQIDELQQSATLELAVQNLSRGHSLLRDVRAALQRIQDGSFGACLQCQRAINSKRLAAVPWAPLCIECQEAADDVDESSGSPLPIGRDQADGPQDDLRVVHRDRVAA
ncbi:MAG: TraR/DksA family transcriptional regulator [Bryobacteraceae bacterium]